MTYNHADIREKWQQRWEETQAFKTDVDSDKPKYYCLEMFPYPSGNLHMGHVRNYGIGDALSRFKRMQGYEVLHPMGFDAFGLPAENAAIKRGRNPADWTHSNIANLKEQFKLLGVDFDWSREIATCNPSYYKWTQWIFQQLYKEGLAYRKEAWVNWDPEDNTVLANEQVVNGRARRSGAKVERRRIKQWFFKITEYADELLEDLEDLDWPEDVKEMQRNWIGKRTATDIEFETSAGNITVFTTRPDTLFGVTYLALAPEHSVVTSLLDNDELSEEAERLVRSVKDRDGDDKRGVDLGVTAKHPYTGEEIPVYVATYVLSDYGEGAVMGVPAHDERDHAFAEKHGLRIKQVIEGDLPVTKKGELVNSGFLTGLAGEEAIATVNERLEKDGLGGEATHYRLQDWLATRQRYWGCPIPVAYTDDDEPVLIPEEDLPVKLPEDVEFTGKENPITTSESFKHVDVRGETLRRETDTISTFVDSSWYFLRYLDPDNNERIFKEGANDWLPVDQYIGGIEHAVQHLLYARFITKFLRDTGYVDVDEPFQELLCQGMVNLDGKKMSKSRGNVVDPLNIIDEYGADTARTFILFLGSPEKQVEWSDDGAEGIYNFLQRCYTTVTEDPVEAVLRPTSRVVESKVERHTKHITRYVERKRFHKAVKELMGLQKLLASYDGERRHEYLKRFTLLLSPFAPHLAEELWERLGHDELCSLQSWPEHDDSRISDAEEYTFSFAENVVKDVEEVKDLAGIEDPTRVDVVIASDWKYDVARIVQGLYDSNEVEQAVPTVMQTEHRERGDAAVKLVQTYQKNPSKLPRIKADKDLDVRGATYLETVFESYNVVSEDEVENAKATQAIPGKPALVLHD